MSATPARDRFAQVGLALGTATLGWLLMQVFHELGHVLHAVASGAVSRWRTSGRARRSAVSCARSRAAAC